MNRASAGGADGAGAVHGVDHMTSRRDLVRWLVEHGFTELPRTASGHRQFERGGVKVAVPDHGRQEMQPKHIDLMARQMALRLGFDARLVKRELKGYA